MIMTIKRCGETPLEDECRHEIQMETDHNTVMQKNKKGGENVMGRKKERKKKKETVINFRTIGLLYIIN